MEDIIRTLGYLILLRIASVSLPPVCGTWRNVALPELHEILLMCVQHGHGDSAVDFTLSTLTLARDVDGSRLYDFDLLRSTGLRAVLKEAWTQFKRMHATLPDTVAAALVFFENLEKRRQLMMRGAVPYPTFLCDESDWTKQCERVLADFQQAAACLSTDVEEELHPHSFLLRAPSTLRQQAWVRQSRRWATGTLTPPPGSVLELPLMETVTGAEFEMLPIYWAVFKLWHKDNSNDGLACDVPGWAAQLFSQHDFTDEKIDAVMAGYYFPDDVVADVESPAVRGALLQDIDAWRIQYGSRTG